MTTLHIILFLLSISGIFLNGYFFRRNNLKGVLLGFLLTVPSTTYSLINGYEYEKLSYVVLNATLIDWTISVVSVLFIWGLGYCVAWITEK